MVATDLPSSIPVTVLTGYLGAGKTTLLNRILTHEHGKKVAVIINEYGEVGIDNQLVIDADEEIFEMNNGCICCTVRGDLIRIISNLMKRRNKFDHLVIETSLDAVVTVVDAKHIHQHWDADEAIEQLAFADVILLNKTDLVTPAELDELEQRIRAMNALAKIHRTREAQVELDQVLGVGAFDLSRALEVDPNFLGEDAHEHDETVGSVAIAESGSLNFDRLNTWIGELLRNQGTDIFRMKGILNIEGEDHRFVFQGVHMLFDGRADRPWKPDETRKNELVFIGRNLDEAQLKESFQACLT
jgi:G3E family GTPase